MFSELFASDTEESPVVYDFSEPSPPEKQMNQAQIKLKLREIIINFGYALLF
jgi:hypothetical protein